MGSTFPVKTKQTMKLKRYQIEQMTNMPVKFSSQLIGMTDNYVYIQLQLHVGLGSKAG